MSSLHSHENPGERPYLHFIEEERERVEGLILKTTQQRGAEETGIKPRGQVCSPGPGLLLVSAGFHSLGLGRTEALRGGCFLSGSFPGSLYGSLQRSAWEACAGTPRKLCVLQEPCTRLLSTSATSSSWVLEPVPLVCVHFMLHSEGCILLHSRPSF